MPCRIYTFLGKVIHYTCTSKWVTLCTNDINIILIQLQHVHTLGKVKYYTKNTKGGYFWNTGCTVYIFYVFIKTNNTSFYYIKERCITQKCNIIYIYGVQWYSRVFSVLKKLLTSSLCLSGKVKQCSTNTSLYINTRYFLQFLKRNIQLSQKTTCTYIFMSRKTTERLKQKNKFARKMYTHYVYYAGG